MTPISKLIGVQSAMIGALALLLGTAVKAEEAPSRIVSVGGAVTEIVYALGEENRLVARDTTSNYPAEALALPDVGYIRRLSPEGVLSVNPDFILAEEGSGPPEAMDLLREASIGITEVPGGFTREAIGARIETVAEVLDVPDKGAALAAKVDAEIAAALFSVTGDHQPKVIFVLSAAGGRVMVGGANTSADAIISLAGGENVATAFDGFKPMTEEAIVTSEADVILMMSRTGDHSLTDADILAHPALGQTPAAQAGAVVRMDGMLLLGFSVRTGEAIATLAKSLADVSG
ncbi:heme/hemin ABC transporter substrate-binding protein [Shimia haliotis]|uniref:Iron complex transport system substrate-binding protein n=1 Tax=Shimia haliotis TaxID=1280847 RepID=A0A1I4C2L9_9RHOB|nr:hemin ABC transporter substrate-binding protein [Shimia haliotis]SFK75308.1 iron complex transport system substrate-binding protein [Shimia haliotis]